MTLVISPALSIHTSCPGIICLLKIISKVVSCLNDHSVDFIIFKIFYRVTGNGNCLFNACSIVLIGDESLSVYLRCLTTIEMFKHASYYANHPIIYGHCLHDKRLDENSIFSIFISQIAYQSFQKNDRIPAVLAEAVNVANNFTYSSFLSLLALSSVIGRPIESYYPTENDAPANVYELLFNSTVSPRAGDLPKHCSVNMHIFRCSSAPLDYVSTSNLLPKKITLFLLCQLSFKM